MEIESNAKVHPTFLNKYFTIYEEIDYSGFLLDKNYCGSSDRCKSSRFLQSIRPLVLGAAMVMIVTPIIVNTRFARKGAHLIGEGVAGEESHIDKIAPALLLAASATNAGHSMSVTRPSVIDAMLEAWSLLDVLAL